MLMAGRLTFTTPGRLGHYEKYQNASKVTQWRMKQKTIDFSGLKIWRSSAMWGLQSSRTSTGQAANFNQFSVLLTWIGIKSSNHVALLDASCDIVIAWLSHYFKLASQPGALLTWNRSPWASRELLVAWVADWPAGKMLSERIKWKREQQGLLQSLRTGNWVWVLNGAKST